jgi:hypothetical protein
MASGAAIELSQYLHDNQMGPPPEQDVHKHFALAPDRNRKSERVQCKFCGKTMTKHVSRMRVHLSKCHLAAVHFMRHVKGPGTSKQSGAIVPNYRGVQNDLGGSSSSSSTQTHELVDVQLNNNSNRQPLSPAFMAALQSLAGPPRKGQEMQQLHERMALLVYMEGLAFDFWTRRDVMAVVSILRPGLVIDTHQHFLPDRDTLATELLQTTKAKVMLKIIKSFAGARGQTVGMSLTNGWSTTNSNNNSASATASVNRQNVLVCTPTPFLLDTLFTPTHGMSPERLLEAIKAQVESVFVHFDSTLANSTAAAAAAEHAADDTTAAIAAAVFTAASSSAVPALSAPLPQIPSPVLSSYPPPQLIGLVTNNHEDTKSMRILAEVDVTLRERNVVVYGCASESLYAHLSDMFDGGKGGRKVPCLLEAIGRVVRFFANTQHSEEFIGFADANTCGDASLFFSSPELERARERGKSHQGMPESGRGDKHTPSDQAKWTHVLRIIQTILFNKDAIRKVAFDDSLRQNHPPFPRAFKETPKPKLNKRAQKRRRRSIESDVNDKQPRLDVPGTVNGDRHINSALTVDGPSIDATLPGSVAVDVISTTMSEAETTQMAQQEAQDEDEEVEEQHFNTSSVKELIVDDKNLFWLSLSALNDYLQPIFMAIQVLQHDLMPLSMVPAIFLMLHRSYAEFITKTTRNKLELLGVNNRCMDHAHESLHRR